MAEKKRPRTYGNWRRPSSPGLGKLGFGGTIAFLGGMILTIIMMAVSLKLGLIVLVLVGLGLAPLLVKDVWGRTLYESVSVRFGWIAHRRKGHHKYVAGPLSRTPETRCMLPGLATGIRVSEARDAHQQPFVMLHHPRPGHVSTVLECAPSGADLVDRDDVDQWVAGWGHWLADLGQESGVVGAAVTVETAPDTGVRLRRAVEHQMTDDSPDIARQAMREVLDTFPSSAARTTVRVSITWTRGRAGVSGRRKLDDMAVEIGSRLPDLMASLNGAGAGAVRPMTARQLAGALRVAYDPSVALDVDETDVLATAAPSPEMVAPGSGALAVTPAAATVDEADDGALDWADAGPVQTEERPGSYLHDGAQSISWVMGEAPRGAVQSTILRRLLEPHPELARKRVTMLYRPYDAARAARLVDTDVLDAQFAATQRKVVRSRDSIQVSAAAKTAEEEAMGAGLVRFGTIVTATMPIDRIDELGETEAVGRLVSVVEHLGTSARMRLRRAWRTQAVTFTAGLPLGLVLPSHVSLPGDWRERV